MINKEQDLLSISDEEDDSSKIIEYDPTGRFAKYNEEIGKGAYKSVFRGYDNESGCEVAWNVVSLLDISENERRRAKLEINILKSLKHKNIISFVHSWHSKKEIVFITEIVNGGSLKSYLKRITRPKLKVIKNWCRQILEGLDYMHSCKVIHRDLKCENILIDNNELKIGDFGLSCSLQTEYTSSVLGTPEFMAPEIYSGKYDTKVDIYAFGMCVLEIVTGMKPFCECRGGTGQVIKKVIEAQKPQSIDSIKNERIKTLILECLQPSELRPTAKFLLENYFSNFDECDNSPVQVNESVLINLTSDSLNPSYLRFNQSRVSKSKNIVPQSHNEVRFSQEQLSLETNDDYDSQFLRSYRTYILTQNDETLQDLEKRQDREIQLLLSLHQQQKYELQQKNNNKQTASGFISPHSLSTLFQDEQKVFPIAETLSSSDDDPLQFTQTQSTLQTISTTKQ